MIKDINEVKECPDCVSDDIVHNVKKQQVICRNCGLIYEPLTPSEEKRFEKTHGIETKKKR